MKKILLTLTFALSYFGTLAQISVVNNGRLGVGTNVVPNDFKVLIDGEENCAAAFKDTHLNAWSWCETSLVNRSDLKSWIVDFNGTHNFFVGSNGAVFSQGVWISSDQKLKSNVTTLQGGLEKLSLLRPVEYNFLAAPDDQIEIERINFGFIAQEVQANLPNLVKQSYRDPSMKDSLLSVNYDMVIPILVSAVQEQQKQIQELEEKLEELNKSESDNHSLEGNQAIQLRVVPNPNDGSFNVDLRSKQSLSEISDFIVTDLTGRSMSDCPITRETDGRTRIDCSALSPGIYVISAVQNSQVISSIKFIVR